MPPTCRQALTILLWCSAPATADAQASFAPGWFGSAQVGWQRMEVPTGTYAGRTGVVGMLRGGRSVGRAADLFGELAWLQTPLNNEVVFVDCISGGCTEPFFSGPIRVLALKAGVRLLSPPEPVRGYVALAPGLYWLASRSPGSAAVVVGGGGSVGAVVRLDPRTALVVDVGYERLLTGGENPRWSVPVTLGVEIH